jgi:hypothetical protein
VPFLASLGNLPARSRGILLPSTGYPYYGNITIDTQNYNLRNQILSAGWNGTTFVDATVMVASGVTLGSNTTATSAFVSGTLPTNSQITVINNGTIIGKGGNGANGPSSVGGNGGNALNLSANTVIINNGIIGGGGGGGGSGGNFTFSGSSVVGGSGGGGGAGNSVGTGGLAASGSLLSGNNGSDGSAQYGGNGGATRNNQNVPVVTLQSGTEYTSSAVYVSSAGASTFWYSINLSGLITALGQSSTVSYSGRIGLKIFASLQNNTNPALRSNYVGQFFWQDFTSGNSKTTATIPATIPSVDSNTGLPNTTSTINLVGYMWGGTGQRSNGTVRGGGYSDFAGPITANSTIWVICAGNGYRSGGTSSSREPDCRGKSYQGWTDQGGGLSGVFTSDPLDSNNEPLLSPGSTAILCIAGGAAGAYSGGTGGGGGGSSGGSGSGSSYNAGGGTQSAGGANDNNNGSVVRNPGFMTGAVIQAGSSTAPGGGGYYGGGGCGGDGRSAGGGGGSGYFRTTGGYSGQTIQATSTAPAGVGSDYYPGNSVAYGTSGGSDGGGNRGQVRLYLR